MESGGGGCAPDDEERRWNPTHFACTPTAKNHELEYSTPVRSGAKKSGKSRRIGKTSAALPA